MTLQQKNKEWRIFFVAFFLLLSFISNAATPEELEEEILFVTSYNSDTKYTYDNINTFVETYRQLGGKYSTIVENMNVTDLNQSRKWQKTLTNILDKHPNAKLVILLGGDGAVSCISKTRSTDNCPYFALWHRATVSVFRKTLLIYRLTNLRVST